MMRVVLGSTFAGRTPARPRPRVLIWLGDGPPPVEIGGIDDAAQLTPGEARQLAKRIWREADRLDRMRAKRWPTLLARRRR